MAKRSNKADPAKAKLKATSQAKPRASATASDDIRDYRTQACAGTLSPEMEAYFAKCEEKLGFVPNVLKAYAFDNAQAFGLCRHVQ